jgi:hypothetical protein
MPVERALAPEPAGFAMERTGVGWNGALIPT